jgi:hypothetical protein
MLKNNQYARVFMNFQQFCKAPKSDKTAKLALALFSLVNFKYNGIDKHEFICKSSTSYKHFARDTKELKELDVIKVIRNEIFINPRVIWSGSDRLREYRTKCFDEGVKKLNGYDEEGWELNTLDACQSELKRKQRKRWTELNSLSHA